MPKSIIITLLLLMISGFSAQAQPGTTREVTYALHGPVQSVRTETATIIKKGDSYVEGPRVLSMTILFNEAGGRPELGLYDARGNLSRRIVIKFEGRRQVEFLNYDGAGRMWLRGTSAYDSDGRVKENATYNGDGSLRSRTAFKRNNQGAVTESAEYDASGTLIDKLSRTYNDAGELTIIERVSYRPDGSLSLRELITMADKRVESVSYNRDGSMAGKSVRVNREINDYGADGSLKKTTVITDPGRLPEESTYLPSGGITKESQKPDEIDAHGNWTKQTKWVTDSQGTRPVKVTYREITYFQSKFAF